MSKLCDLKNCFFYNTYTKEACMGCVYARKPVESEDKPVTNEPEHAGYCCPEHAGCCCKVSELCDCSIDIPISSYEIAFSYAHCGGAAEKMPSTPNCKEEPRMFEVAVARSKILTADGKTLYPGQYLYRIGMLDGRPQVFHRRLQTIKGQHSPHDLEIVTDLTMEKIRAIGGRIESDHYLPELYSTNKSVMDRMEQSYPKDGSGLTIWHGSTLYRCEDDENISKWRVKHITFGKNFESLHMDLTGPGGLAMQSTDFKTFFINEEQAIEAQHTSAAIAAIEKRVAKWTAAIWFCYGSLSGLILFGLLLWLSKVFE